ncbi:hypothetical protein AB204_02295 [Xenorhabdus khoisanae]|uniref:Uncharacterized protein n=1 Tax=Xenorhabdus khoisanae TaxID=880157 RepID=A0A0J5FXJ2_9GAMM|nr:hypothetical protein [Xenorhabdus khoisanae]KMJ46672.1 hypothetical protein AB204_02295 [Xenorhabdus khoisanae]
MTVPKELFNQVVQTETDVNFNRIKALVLNRSSSQICKLVTDSVSVCDLAMALDYFVSLQKKRDAKDDFASKEPGFNENFDDFSKTIKNIRRALCVLSPPPIPEEPEKKHQTLN